MTARHCSAGGGDGILRCMQPEQTIPADRDLADATRETVMRYHLSWKHRDIDAVMALYHPEVEYNDFFQNRRMRLADLREYVEATMPKGPDESLEHTDRIRFDGDTAFIQYRLRVTLSGRLASFRASEAITVRDGLIWRINEYASLVHESGGGAQAGGDGRPQVVLQVARQQAQPYLDPDLDLTQVANATGYTRNQISYLLNQVLGLSFYQYVNQTRLQHLLGQLSGELPGRVDELAFAAGFNSLSAFYRCFRQHTGQSPREYLKRLSSRR
ncbi:DUF4440 domain-containing protein [Pseudomonas aeruginosa]|nr:DUF4440 domain-containing protein [Pseudomonas aeruginosa]